MRRLLINAVLLLLCQVWAYGFESEIIMGKEDKWSDFISFSGITLQDGKWGTLDLFLEDQEHKTDGQIDLLLDFNSQNLSDNTRNYAVTANKAVVSKKTLYFGSGSYAFAGSKSVVEMAPLEGALFYPGTLWDDFTIQFWIYPVTLSDGEVVFSWNGLKGDGIKTSRQAVSCVLKNRVLIWKFDNFFGTEISISRYYELKSTTPMLPQKWYHCLVRFNSTDGLLEFLINGIAEDIIYATDSGKEGSTVNLPYIGGLSMKKILIGPNFNGFLDEWVIQRQFLPEPDISKKSMDTGIAVSRIFDLEYSGATLKRIDADYKTPSDTAVYFYYKIDEKLFTYNSLAGDWIGFRPGEPFDPVTTRKGQYLQIRIEMMPGGRRDVSPQVSMVKIIFEPDLPPAPPGEIMATSKDKSAQIVWRKVNEHDVKGYMIFYGNLPGNYTGKGLMEGDSPIRVGNVNQLTLTGMENGKLYYIAVVAFDSSDPPHLSSFSREVSVRPSSLSR